MIAQAWLIFVILVGLAVVGLWLIWNWGTDDDD